MIFWLCIIISKYSIVILFSLLSEFNWLKLWKIDEEQIGNYIIYAGNYWANNKFVNQGKMEWYAIYLWVNPHLEAMPLFYKD